MWQDDIHEVARFIKDCFASFTDSVGGCGSSNQPWLTKCGEASSNPTNPWEGMAGIDERKPLSCLHPSPFADSHDESAFVIHLDTHEDYLWVLDTEA